jgi:hypothetical protein
MAQGAIMTMDPKYRRLLDDVSAADAPPPELEDVLWQKLAGRLSGPLPPTAAAAEQALATKVVASSVVIKLVVASVIAGTSVAGFMHYRSERAPEPAASEAPRALPAPPVAAPPPEVSRPTEPSSTLLAETELLTQAQRELRRGRPERTLTLIEQHATRFPQGALAQEREAARVIALCTLGRLSESRRAQQAFLQTWPGSPLTERVQSACIPAR